MAFFDELTKKAKDVANLAADKAKDAAELTKITCQDDRRLSVSQSQPRNRGSPEAAGVCSVSADPSLLFR